jgi:hypothetical protein
MKAIIRSFMVVVVLAAGFSPPFGGAEAATGVPRYVGAPVTPAATAVPTRARGATVAPTSTLTGRAAATATPASTRQATRTPVPATAVPTRAPRDATSTAAPPVPTTRATPTPAPAAPVASPRTPMPIASPTNALRPPAWTTPGTAKTTPTALPSASATPSSLPLRVTEISPALIRNDRDRALVMAGSGFVNGMTLAIGEKVLTNVAVESSTRLTATLPSGLCPGPYSVTMMAPSRRAMSGDAQLRVEGVRTATLGTWAASPPIGVSGKARTIALELPTVEVVDTTCSTDDWQLALTFGSFSPFEDGRGALLLRGLKLDGADRGRSGSALVAAKGGTTEGTLNVPHGIGQTTASLRPLIGVDVPSHGYAGQYRMSVAVSIAGGTPDEGTRPPGGGR